VATSIVTETKTTEDADLVRAVLDGERAAFGSLYDRYAGLIRAICYDATGQLESAQDLAQEVFLRAHRKLGSLRNHEKFASWAIGIAKQVSREWRRRKGRDRHLFVGVGPEGALADNPVPADDSPEQLYRAIAMLGEKQRLAIHAFYLMDRSADDARRVLGLSRSGFYKLLQRARNRLRRLMQEGGR